MLQRPLRIQNKRHSKIPGDSPEAGNSGLYLSRYSPGNGLFTRNSQEPCSRATGKLSVILVYSDHCVLVEPFQFLHRWPLNFDGFSKHPCQQKHKLWHPQRLFLFFVGEFQPTYLFVKDP